MVLATSPKQSPAFGAPSKGGREKGRGQSLSPCYRIWKARGRPASRRTSSTVDVLALRHPLQWDGGRRWYMGLDDAGIDRILNNVGDVPGTLDKSELREDILAAWDFYQGYKRADSKGARTERRDHAIKIAHKTNELIRLLNYPAGDWVRSRIGRLLSLRERNEPLRERNEDEKIVSLASLTRSLDELLSV